MPQFEHNGAVYQAIRYQPAHPGHMVHRLTSMGVPCVHLQPSTHAIAVFDPLQAFEIRDPRHAFEGAEGMVYPGDWIAWQRRLELEIIPSQVFAERYAPVDA